MRLGAPKDEVEVVGMQTGIANTAKKGGRCIAPGAKSHQIVEERSSWGHWQGVGRMMVSSI